MMDMARSDLCSPDAVWDVADRVVRLYAPPPSLTVSEFADAEIVVTAGELANARWRTDYAPYQRGLMDVFSEPGIQTAVMKLSSQVGKTAINVNLASYHIAHDPCEVLVVLPSLDMAKDFVTNRLDAVIARSPRLAAVFAGKRRKDKIDTVFAKAFPGGALTAVGAHSASSLAARPIRVLICDEVDRWPTELKGEGNTVTIAMKRTTSYRRRKRVVLSSSPTIPGSPIDDWHLRGDQRVFKVPCPSCGYRFAYQWEHVKWVNRDPSTARIHCPACDYGLDDIARIVAQQPGEWVPTNPDRPDKSIASFWAWEAYSPMSSLASIVSSFLAATDKARRGDNSELHTWQNTTLAQAVEPDTGAGIDATHLITTREVFPAPVPQDACCLVGGIDTQDDRLEATVIGFGVDDSMWYVEHRIFYGDTSHALRGPWLELGAWIAREHRHASGQMLPVHAWMLDTAGHRTTEAYEFARQHRDQHVWASVGRSGPREGVSRPKKQQYGRARSWVWLHTIGVDRYKALLVSRLQVGDDADQQRMVHLPTASWCDVEWVEQLTSEVLEKKFTRGRAVYQWVKRRARNEALDCSVMAMAAFDKLRPDMDGLAAALAVSTTPEPDAPVVVPADDALTPARDPWITRRPGGWMR